MNDISNNIARGFGPRLMRRHPPFQNAEAEHAELRALLASAPGVVTIREVKSHPRGGCVAVMDFAMPQLDAWIAHLEARGWTGVI